ncbi:MAG: hypothetical protein KGZ59_04865 [Chitinophagaceae bacterium]|nr:hypothetical protein [Chitinophagaceae bacterium]
MEETIHQIKSKVQLLIKQYQQLQKINLKLRTELTESKIKLDQQKDLIENLESKIDATKINLNQLSKQDKLSLEKRIDGYLKEVNTCLTLLNKD